MTAPMTHTNTITDFTIDVEPIVFKINEDIFDAYVDLPAFTLIEFATRAAQIDTDNADANAALRDLFEMILKPTSAEVFIARLADRERPISMRHIEKIIPWLLERYGMRPQVPSQDSSSGSPNLDGGTSSTVTTLPAASISGRFP